MNNYIHSTATPNEYKIPVQEMDQTRYYRFELKSLVRSPQYGISVSASTDAGEGPPTEVVNRDLTSRGKYEWYNFVPLLSALQM